MTGEFAGYAMERLLEAGALDVFYTPIYMKKNRPAFKLSVLCKEENIDKINKIILRETSTIGIRINKVDRVCMERDIKSVETPYGDIKVKVSSYEDITKVTPEYEDCRKIAIENNIALNDIYKMVSNKFNHDK